MRQADVWASHRSKYRSDLESQEMTRQPHPAVRVDDMSTDAASEQHRQNCTGTDTEFSLRAHRTAHRSCCREARTTICISSNHPQPDLANDDRSSGTCPTAGLESVRYGPWAGIDILIIWHY